MIVSVIKKSKQKFWGFMGNFFPILDDNFCVILLFSSKRDYHKSDCLDFQKIAGRKRPTLVDPVHKVRRG